MAQLGEHGIWGKMSNFDLAVRVPLLVKVPGKPQAAGQKTASLIDLVDVFPTLASLAGLLAPVAVDGDDVSSLFDEPTRTLKQAAYHQYPACGMAKINQTRTACNKIKKKQFDFMGYSVRTASWRYTLWLPWDQQKLVAKWEAAASEVQEELYAHDGDDSTDMDRWENVNFATSQPSVAAQHRKLLKAFFAKKKRAGRRRTKGSGRGSALLASGAHRGIVAG